MDASTHIEMLDELSHGRFGRVFRARDRRTFKQLAVKVAAPPTAELFSDLVAQVASLRQGTADSLFVCQYHNGFFVEQGRGPQKLAEWRGSNSQGGPGLGEYWVLMEHCGGGTLHDLIEFSPGKALRAELIAEVCASTVEGLRHLHAHGIAHGDLQASNVMLTQRGQCKIGGVRLLPEFRGSNTTHRHHHHRRHARVPADGTAGAGGVSWIAPELLPAHSPTRGSSAPAAAAADLDRTVPGGASPMADVWALGALTMRMADGRAVGGGTDDRTVRNAATWTDEFSLFVFSCLGKSPEQRVPAAALAAQPFVAHVVRRLKEANGCSRALQAEVQAFRTEFQRLRHKRALISESRHALERAAAAEQLAVCTQQQQQQQQQRQQQQHVGRGHCDNDGGATGALTASVATPRSAHARGDGVVQCPRCRTVLKAPVGAGARQVAFLCGQCGAEHTLASIDRQLAVERRWDAHGDDLAKLLHNLGGSGGSGGSSRSDSAGHAARAARREQLQQQAAAAFGGREEGRDDEEVMREVESNHPTLPPPPQCDNGSELLPAPPPSDFTALPGLPPPPSEDGRFLPPPKAPARSIRRSVKRNNNRARRSHLGSAGACATAAVAAAAAAAVAAGFEQKGGADETKLAEAAAPAPARKAKSPRSGSSTPAAPALSPAASSVSSCPPSAPGSPGAAAAPALLQQIRAFADGGQLSPTATSPPRRMSPKARRRRGVMHAARKNSVEQSLLRMRAQLAADNDDVHEDDDTGTWSE